MEQIWAFIADHTLYTAAGYAVFLLVLMMFAIHRINRSMRLQKKHMKKIQDMMQAMEDRQNGAKVDEPATDDIPEDKEEGQALAMDRWTSEQEHLVNEVLGEVFS